MERCISAFSKMVESGIICHAQTFRVYAKDYAKSSAAKMNRCNTCVYLLLDGDTVSYVGQTGYLQGRISNHCSSRRIVFDTVLAIIIDCFGADYRMVNTIERSSIELFRPKNNKEWNPDYKRRNH